MLRFTHSNYSVAVDSFSMSAVLSTVLAIVGLLLLLQSSILTHLP
jgi:hypothetical protein